MPYSIRKVTNKKCYKVYNSKSGRVFSKCSTRKNAYKQLYLLRGLSRMESK
jgi:hypothetical protein